MFKDASICWLSTMLDTFKVDVSGYYINNLPNG